jgi:hypothetical protein
MNAHRLHRRATLLWPLVALAAIGCSAGANQRQLAATPPPTNAARIAAEELERAAAAISRLLDQQAGTGGRALTSDFLALRWEWSRRTFLAARIAEPDVDRRIHVAEEHRIRMRQLQAAIRRGDWSGRDDPVITQLSAYYVAEAELWLAEEQGATVIHDR